MEAILTLGAWDWRPALHSTPCIPCRALYKRLGSSRCRLWQIGKCFRWMSWRAKGCVPWCVQRFTGVAQRAGCVWDLAYLHVLSNGQQHRRRQCIWPSRMPIRRKLQMSQVPECGLLRLGCWKSAFVQKLLEWFSVYGPIIWMCSCSRVMEQLRCNASHRL